MIENLEPFLILLSRRVKFFVNFKKSKFTKFCLRIFDFLIWKLNEISRENLI